MSIYESMIQGIEMVHKCYLTLYNYLFFTATGKFTVLEGKTHKAKSAATYV